MGVPRLPDASDGALRLYPGFAKGRAGTIGAVEGVTRLQTLLGEAFPDAQDVDVVDRTGGGDHFHVTVVSPRFEGISLLEQHRLVNEALADPLRDGTIHELRITTRRPTNG
jgi:stress-induced morphogen